MLAESALCLAFDDNPPTAGQVTTAVAMGDRPARAAGAGRSGLHGAPHRRGRLVHVPGPFARFAAGSAEPPLAWIQQHLGNLGEVVS